MRAWVEEDFLRAGSRCPISDLQFCSLDATKGSGSGRRESWKADGL